MSTDLTALIQVATDILNLLPNVALIEQHIRSCWKIIIKVLWSAEIVVVCIFRGWNMHYMIWEMLSAHEQLYPIIDQVYFVTGVRRISALV